MMNAIIHEVATIPAEMLVRLVEDFVKRPVSCIQNDGHNLDDSEIILAYNKMANNEPWFNVNIK